MVVLFKDLQTRLSRGRRSRNKVSVGEPAEGSLSAIGRYICLLFSGAGECYTTNLYTPV